MTTGRHSVAFTLGLTAAGVLFILSMQAFAAAKSSAVNFSHKDWDLICDNTLTCRAAGYSTEDSESGVSVLITRKAGPATAVTNQVKLAEYEEDDSSKKRGTPQLLIDNQPQGALSVSDDDGWLMNRGQFAAFIKALPSDNKISFKDKQSEYVLSGAGASAVLLKMDDVQGRVNTTGALIKKGSNSEANVKPPVPAPEIRKAPVRDKEMRDITPQETARYKPALMKLIASMDTNCTDDRLAQKWQIAGLNARQSLLMIPCWLAAYNGGDFAIVIANDMASAPVIVTDSATGYSDGMVDFAMKGRGLGDCWSHDAWVWDGKRFVHGLSSDTGRCALIRAGGAWDLPSLVSTLVKH